MDGKPLQLDSVPVGIFPDPEILLSSCGLHSPASKRMIREAVPFRLQHKMLMIVPRSDICFTKFILPSSNGSLTKRLKNGTDGYSRSVSLITASMYFIGSDSWPVSSTTSSYDFCWMSACFDRRYMANAIAELVVSWP